MMKIFINRWITFLLLAGLSNKKIIMANLLKRFDPAIHHRQSIRYKGCDYCSPGLYVITIKTQAFKCLFGEIRSGMMHLNEYGKLVDDEWLKTTLIRSYIYLDTYVIMPDHFHGIIGIKPSDIPPPEIDPVGATQGVAPTKNHPNGPKSGSIGAIIGQFKMQTTKRINALRFGAAGHASQRIGDSRIWQRNYYDRIIRDEVALRRIREYIINNPGNVKTKHRKV